jgi:hypothetical protein
VAGENYPALERRLQLAELRWHWGDAYAIAWTGAFRAVRRDNRSILTAGSAEELRMLIRADYGHRPVPRRA